MQRAPENYFVRVDAIAAPETTAPHRSRRARTPKEPKPHRPRHHRRGQRRSIFMLALAVTLGGWLFWAVHQPGGVSGTVNGFIDHVRGQVQGVGSDASLSHAADYLDNQYNQNGTYPQLTDEQMAQAGISVDVDLVPCSSQAVVLQTMTVSRLLIAGHEHGDVAGRVPCPDDLNNPAPWK